MDTFAPTADVRNGWKADMRRPMLKRDKSTCGNEACVLALMTIGEGREVLALEVREGLQS
jgi:hypothetical protein